MESVGRKEDPECLVKTQQMRADCIVNLQRGSQSHNHTSLLLRLWTIKCVTDHYYSPIVFLVSILSIAICFNSKFVSPFKVNTGYRQHLEEQSLLESFELRSTQQTFSSAKTKSMVNGPFNDKFD